MKHLNRILVFISFLIMGLSSAQAQFMLKGVVSLDNTTAKSTIPSATDAKENITFTSLGAGYVLGNGLYLGGIYETKTDKTVVVGTGTFEDNYNQMGAAIGYVVGNWQFIFNYFVNASNEDVSNNEFTGTGMGVDLGYGFDVGNGVKLGVQLGYRSFTYDKYKVVGAPEVATDYKVTELAPAILISWKM
ncbi:MAG: hypothetical protein SGJ18_06910 [Pseudomonadota bacterium]|nr:hypothetical protein [Pseudomonadota bacterium]